MTQPSHLAAALSILTGLVIAGCKHDSTPTANPPSPAPGTGVPEGVANTQNAADLAIVARLATARCERAQACNDIGAGKARAAEILGIDLSTLYRWKKGRKAAGHRCVE